MFRKLNTIHRSEQGITGLETAIILIAFVVVAAVFAYTVLSAGLFSSQKSQEAVYSGLEETQSTLEMRGNVIAYKGDANIGSSVGKIEITVSNSLKGGDVIDLTPPYIVAGGALVGSGLNNPTIISYVDDTTTIANCAWTLDFVGKASSDYLLESDEKAVITIWLHTYDGAVWAAGANPPFLAGNNVDANHTFTAEIKPSRGAVLTVERTMPGYLDTVIDLQ
ncbi:MAG: hypothetical protein PHE50_09555 [Dehalococcoidales bacterium]|nr:hypothetical protein [Dehalococcoidales bacterium]